MTNQSKEQRLNDQALMGEVRSATAAHRSLTRRVQVQHETSDTYTGIVVRLCDRHRVVICRDHIQWILQRRKRGGAERPWRSVGYFRTREALIRACASLCGRIDPAAMAILLALPAQIGGAA